MPTLTHISTPAGVTPAPYNAETLVALAQSEPADGVYTITNTYATTQALRLDAHFDRLEDSARHAGIALTLDRARLRRDLRQLIVAAGFGDVRFRVTVGRDAPDTYILSVEPFHGYPAAIYSSGVRCITLPDAARTNPAAKTTDWMLSRQQFTLPDGVHEGLLIDADGAILEGMSSNFYAVSGGRLYTAASGVLPGIAQQIVLEIAPEVVPLVREPVRIDALAQISEAFITSASRGIVPVVQIDDVPIGAGTPGTVTRALRERYAAWVAAHLEEI